MNAHHAGGEFKSTGSLLLMTLFGPNVRNHNCLAITTKRVTEHISKLGLTVRNVVTLAVTKGKDDLLKERKRLVDEAGLLEYLTLRVGLLGALRTGQVNQVQLGVDNLIRRFDAGARLDVHSEDAVSTRGSGVEVVVAEGAVHFSLKKTV